MKPITREWLTLAQKDLAGCQKLLGDDFLTNIVCFHAQQAVEKSLKAIVEEFEIGFVKTHNLVHLFERIKEVVQFELDEDTLKALNEVYISVRYPGEFGLLPHGEPTVEDARLFYQFAQTVFNAVTFKLE